MSEGRDWLASGAIALSAIVFAVLLHEFKNDASRNITGHAAVIDGDTITVDHDRIRLYGIDAPEYSQDCFLATGQPWHCGIEATKALARLIGEQPVHCKPQTKDIYGRKVSICYSQQYDLGEEMVLQGMAIAYRRYSSKYVPQETTARVERRGMWVGRFERPEFWRQSAR